MRRTLFSLVTAEGISVFGSQLSALAIPWFVLSTTGSPERMGIVFAVELLPLAVLGLPSGVVIDRVGARSMMLVCDVVRAPIVALIPALHIVGHLSFATLLVLVAVLGAFSTPYFAAQRLIIPQVVGRQEGVVARANTLVEGASNIASFAGPAAAGVLIGALGAAPVLWIDAATFGISFVTILLFVPARDRSPHIERRGAMLGGARYIIGDSLVARAATSSLVFGFVFRLLFVSFPLLAFYRYDRDPKVAGALSAAWGAGAVLGSIAAYRLVGRARHPLNVAAIAAAGTALPLWFLVPNLGFVVVALAVATSAAAIPMINAPYLALLATRVPEHLQGRVLQTIMTVNNFAGPLGYVVGSVIFTRLGLGWTYALIATGASLAGLNFLLAAFGAQTERPQSGDNDVAGGGLDAYLGDTLATADESQRQGST
jgi:MFS family permease